MANVVVDDTKLTAIADMIRGKSDGAISESMTLDQMASNLDSFGLTPKVRTVKAVNEIENTNFLIFFDGSAISDPASGDTDLGMSIPLTEAISRVNVGYFEGFSSLSEAEFMDLHVVTSYTPYAGGKLTFTLRVN